MKRHCKKSLKLVVNELESEGASEKLRFNGFPIDNRMLEELVRVGLLGRLVLRVGKF